LADRRRGSFNQEQTANGKFTNGQNGGGRSHEKAKKEGNG